MTTPEAARVPEPVPEPVPEAIAEPVRETEVVPLGRPLRADAALTPLWRPASVAVVGASDDPAKWGHWLARGALLGREIRAVHLVNRRGGPVCGRPAFPSLGGLPHAPELVVIAVPAPAVEAAFDDALAAGARAVLVISDGLGRLTGNPRLADHLGDRARERGVRLLGPSSLGIVDTHAQLRLAWGDFPAGPVGVVTQSGQIGTEIAYLLARLGSGVSRFASTGAQADICTEDLLDSLAGHDATRAVIAYVEGIRDPQRFLRAAHLLREAGKPLVLLTVGSSPAGSAAALSHTGALTSGTDILEAVCRSVGAVRATTPAHAADLAHALALGVRPRGSRILVVSDSGGQGALAADLATERGLDLATPPTTPPQSPGPVPAPVEPRNPVDLAGAGEQDLTVYASVAEWAATAGTYDALVLTGYFGRYGEDIPTLATTEAEVAARLARVTQTLPVLVHTMAGGSPATQTLRAAGVPVYADIDSTLRALAGCAQWQAATPRPPGRHPTAPPGPPGPHLAYLQAREVARAVGIAFPEAGVAESAREAVRIARAWDGPSVAKVVGHTHKTEVGGVRLGLETDADITAAFEDFATRLGASSVVIERMDTRPDTVELIVGLRYDPGFGPVVLVGAGGTSAELWRDTALELAPVTIDGARAMLRRLTCRPLLNGWRGAAPCDVDAVAAAVAALSTLPGRDPTVVSAEINPLRAGPDGVLAVDVLIERARTRRPHGKPHRDH
ncbi:acetate--CoA ligase family protein [Streptomyces sp. NPDC101150]|uniref:acetate--CoA ligase family protein n=1 Tax=Streptomyces sp. NPDC101150 TaxID=3366114 RepID=UPI0037FEF47C